MGLLVGGTWVPPGALLYALLHPHAHGVVAIILWQLRLPRVAVAALVGAALAIAGALLQGLLRNPLVDPYLTGTSAGAAAAIALAVALGLAAPLYPAIGFVAGLATAFLVAALARRGSGLDANRLILAGISISALFSALVALVLARTHTADEAEAILAWLAGSMAGRGWHDLAMALPYTIVGTALAFAAAPAMNALRIGELRAHAVGVNVARTQWVVLAAASLLTASAVALAGIIGFLGLIVPHLARRVVGADVRTVVVASALLGVALCTLADAMSRTIVAPSELPIGVLLAFVGVPTFLVLYLRSKERRT
ncbi:MAG: FecCD family ABC transporter permease [Vulcanimicrobiaceae bacterium]